MTKYQVTADAGRNPETGKRQQVRRRYATERQARAALAEISNAAELGTFVPRRAITVREVCENYIAGRHRLRSTSKAKLAYDLQPLVERHGDEPVQRLNKSQLDQLVIDLLEGGTRTAKGRRRRPRGPVSVNKFVQTVNMVLADAQRQGLVARNVAEHLDPVAVRRTEVPTYTEAEVEQILRTTANDRLGHAWELALCGLRRGEIAGLRWADVDLERKTLSITNNRVDAGGKALENDPKSAMSRRVLPLPDRLVAVLKAAKKRQAAERLALGGGLWEYVVSNELGDPYHPQAISRHWREAVKGAGLRPLKLHAARHTAATKMHLDGVPVAVIAEWIGHKDASLTMRLYAHSQADALKTASAAFDRVVTSS
ncbi:site-specific integrase [Mycolicibacterium elephantis]